MLLLSALSGVPADVEALSALRLARMRILASHHGCQIAPSPGKGLGVFATRLIEQFAKLGEYNGELLNQRDVDARYGPMKRSPGLWTSEDEEWLRRREKNCVGLTGHFVFKVDEDIFIDAEDPTASCWTRFFNHSDEPNVKARSIPVSIDKTPKVWFYALRDIEAGEELMYDYGSDFWGDNDLPI